MTPSQKDYIGELMQQHASMMVQLTYRRTGDRQLSEELVQDTFLTACQKADVLCSHDKPLAWLYQTLQYLTIKELNKAYHARETLRDDIDDFGNADGHLPFQELLPNDLTADERRILTLRFEHHLSHREISEVLGITEMACRQLMSRLYKKCRSLLSQTPGCER